MVLLHSDGIKAFPTTMRFHGGPNSTLSPDYPLAFTNNAVIGMFAFSIPKRAPVKDKAIHAPQTHTTAHLRAAKKAMMLVTVATYLPTL